MAIFDNNLHTLFVAVLANGSLGYTKVIAHAQREPNSALVVMVITAERTSPWKQTYKLRLTATHNVFVREEAGDKDYKAR